MKISDTFYFKILMEIKVINDESGKSSPISHDVKIDVFNGGNVWASV